VYSEEYAESAWGVLEDHLVPLLFRRAGDRGGRLPEAVGLSSELSAVRGNLMAKACLEMAVLDCELRERGVSLADHLGVDHYEARAGAVLGLVDPGDTNQLDAAVTEVGQLFEEGFERVKVKISPGSDVAILKTLRRAFPTLGLQADANGAYTLDDPEHVEALSCLDDLDLLCVEQPLDPDDLLGHSRLADRLRTPVCLDESIGSLGRLADAIALGACDMVCIKPGPIGGLLEATKARAQCVEAGIAMWCGGMLETAFARGANAAVSCLPGFTLPGDIAGGVRFKERDPFLTDRADDATTVARPLVAVHRGPGVGPVPDPEALDRVTARTSWLPAR